MNKNQEPATAEAVIEARERSHGDYNTQARTAQEIKAAISRAIDKDLTVLPYHRESLDMIATKISRIVHGNPDEPDHWLDIAGYATLVHQILTKKA